MALNIHPIFVHIPIAFLAVYSIFEMLQFKAVKKLHFWTPLKFAMLAIGLLGAFASLSTGDLGEAQYRNTPARAIIGVHSTFAGITTVFFSVLFILYAAHVLNGYFKNKTVVKVVKGLDRVHEIMLRTWVGLAVGIVGLALISITGALGGAIAYGPDVDPIVHFVYSLFF